MAKPQRWPWYLTIVGPSWLACQWVLASQCALGSQSAAAWVTLPLIRTVDHLHMYYQLHELADLPAYLRMILACRDVSTLSKLAVTLFCHDQEKPGACSVRNLDYE